MQLWIIGANAKKEQAPVFEINTGIIMVENTNLRQDQDRPGANPFETYDVEYFRTKYNLTTKEVEDAVHEVKSNNAIDLDEYLSQKTGIPKDKA